MYLKATSMTFATTHRISAHASASAFKPLVHRQRRTASRLRGLALASIAMLAWPVMAATYTFTSPNYATGYIGGPGPTMPYTTAMQITGTITTAVPLPANMPLTPIGPGASPELVTSWSFSDGVRTYNAGNSALLYGLPARFAVATDATGQIIAQDIGLIQAPPPHALNQVVTTLSSNAGLTLVVADALCQSVSAGAPVICNSVNQVAGTISAQGPGGGTWLRAADPAAVPTLSLAGLGAMGAALAGMAAWARRRRGA